MYYIFYDREYFSVFIQENTICTRMKQRSIVLIVGGSAQRARTLQKSEGNKWGNIDRISNISVYISAKAVLLLILVNLHCLHVKNCADNFSVSNKPSFYITIMASNLAISLLFFAHFLINLTLCDDMRTQSCLTQRRQRHIFFWFWLDVTTFLALFVSFVTN